MKPRRNEALDVPEDKYMQYKALGSNVNGRAKGFVGYATKYYFYQQGDEIEDPIVQYPWYFGTMSRQECKVNFPLNLYCFNCDLLHTNLMCSFRKFCWMTINWMVMVHSLYELEEKVMFCQWNTWIWKTTMFLYLKTIKFTTMKSNPIITHNEIQFWKLFCRHKKFYIERDRQYITLNDLIESYKQKHKVIAFDIENIDLKHFFIQTKLKTNLSGICLVPNPDVNKDFKDSLNIHYENDAWSIPRQEIEIEREIGRGNFGVVSIGTIYNLMFKSVF